MSYHKFKSLTAHKQYYVQWDLVLKIVKVQTVFSLFYE